jgi:hypothetical protein
MSEISELMDKYDLIVLPKLAELEQELQNRIKSFEKEYSCYIMAEMPSVKDKRQGKRITLLLGKDYTAACSQVVQRLGLNQSDYPFLQHS